MSGNNIGISFGEIMYTPIVFNKKPIGFDRTLSSVFYRTN